MPGEDLELRSAATERFRAADAQDRRLVDVVAPLWSAAKTQQALGSNSDLVEACRAGEVLGLTAQTGTLSTPWRNSRKSADGSVRVKPALITFLVTLRDHDSWTVAVLLNTAADELDGLTPLDWARQLGHQQALGDYAALLAAERSR